jgi:hypothetical protein
MFNSQCSILIRKERRRPWSSVFRMSIEHWELSIDQILLYLHSVKLFLRKP